MILLRRRNTVAFAVWLAGCAAIWHLTPVVPRVVVPRPDAGEVLGFTDDGRGAYGFMYGSFNPERDYFVYDDDRRNPDGPFRVWDVQTGRPLITRESRWTDFARGWFPPYAAALIYSAVGQPIYCLDLRTGIAEPLPDDIGPFGEEPPVLTPDGRYLGVLTLHRSVQWYDRHSKKVIASFPDQSPSTFRPFHSDGRWATVQKQVGANGEYVLLIREPVTGRVITRYETTEDIRVGEFSPDGRYLLVSSEGAYSIIDESGDRSHIRTSAEIDHVYFVDAEHLMTEHRASDGSSYLDRWETATGNHLGRYHVPTDFRVGLHFDSVRRHILIASTGNSGLIGRLPPWTWDLPGIGFLLRSDICTYRVLDGITERLLGEYRLISPAAVRMSPDGRTLVNVSVNGTLEFWDIPARKPLARVAIALLAWTLPVAWLTRRRARKPASGVA